MRAVLADGGATRNGTLIQLQADVLGVPVVRSAQEELSALGAAMLGGLTLGWWPSLGHAPHPACGQRTFLPTWSSDERARRYAGWQQAVRRCRLAAEEGA